MENEKKTTSEYLEQADLGSIVAFELKPGTIISGKIVARSIDNDTEQVAYSIETKSGEKFIVYSESVVWVKTGVRWPRWVYNQFKKGGSNGSKND